MKISEESDVRKEREGQERKREKQERGEIESEKNTQRELIEIGIET